MFIFFFQAEDGIRDLTVTGVQTCALPIFESRRPREVACGRPGSAPNHPSVVKAVVTWDETDHTHQVSTRRTGHDTLGRSHTVKARTVRWTSRSEEHTSELQSQSNLVCRLLLEKKT